MVFATEFPVESAEDAIARADRALAEGDMDLALYMYVRAYDLDKENVHALARIGDIHESRGNDRLATMAFSAVLQFDPNHAGALQSLGLIYLQAKRRDEALDLLERAISQDPLLWRAQNGIGIIADMQGEHAKAIEAYDAALAANPGDASLLNNRGYSLYLDGQYQAASKDFLEAAAQGAERAWLSCEPAASSTCGTLARAWTSCTCPSTPSSTSSSRPSSATRSWPPSWSRPPS